MVLLDFKPGRSDWRHLPGSFFHISISSFLVYVHFVLFYFVVQSFYHLFHDFQYLFQALVRIKLHCKASAGEPFRLVIDRYIEFTFDGLYDLAISFSPPSGWNEAVWNIRYPSVHCITRPASTVLSASVSRR